MNIKDLIGETVLNDIENVTHALKLQELVKERIKSGDKYDLDRIVTKALKFFVEESKK